MQSDNDFSLSGIPLTALHFCHDSHILVSGDQSGTVSMFSQLHFCADFGQFSNKINSKIVK